MKEVSNLQDKKSNNKKEDKLSGKKKDTKEFNYLNNQINNFEKNNALDKLKDNSSKNGSNTADNKSSKVYEKDTTDKNDYFKKYNLNSKIINDYMDNPSITNVENAPMFLPKEKIDDDSDGDDTDNKDQDDLRVNYII